MPAFESRRARMYLVTALGFVFTKLWCVVLCCTQHTRLSVAAPAICDCRTPLGW
jgi:hypothetical protein